MRDWLIVRLIDTATGVALLSGILHPTTVVNTVTNLASLGQDKRQSRIRNQENLRRKKLHTASLKERRSESRFGVKKRCKLIRERDCEKALEDFQSLQSE